MLLVEKMAQANAEQAIGEAKKWQKGELSRLTAMKEEARAEIR